MQFGSMMGAPDGLAGGMSPQEKRKFVKEIKDEMKPLINQLCEFQIMKSNELTKV